MSDFNLNSVADRINGMIDDYKLQKVCMQGCHNDLEKLKPIIEKLYDEHIFYIDYWVCECGYHGWDLSNDNGKLKSQRDITKGIRKKFMEIYALILAGLGEKCEGITAANEVLGE